MTALNRAAAGIGEYSDDYHNGNGQSPSPGRTVTNIAPATAVVGASVTIQVTGTGFEDDSDVAVDGVEIPTTFVSSTSIRGTYTPAAARTSVVTVGGATGSRNLTVTGAAEE